MTLEEIETQAAELAQFYKKDLLLNKLCIKTHQVLQQIKIK
jgi:predicted RNase H-like HicB family nuclease